MIAIILVLVTAHYDAPFMSPQTDIFISSTPSVISFQYEGKTHTFDCAGRPLMSTMEGRSFVRGLDGRIKEKSWPNHADVFDRNIRDLSDNEARQFHRDIFQAIQNVQAHIRSGRKYDVKLLHGERDPQQDVDDILRSLLSWGPQKLSEDEKAFQRLYKPISILPPDQYYCVPVQIVEGCPWNKCSFCDFYKNRSFRIRSFEEISKHVSEIKDFFGKSLSLRHSIFLCDANAFVMRTPELLPVLHTLREKFPDQAGPRGGIYTFGDVPAVLARSTRDLEALRFAGLKRVYIGLESGSDVVRRLIDKPGKKKDVLRAVQSLKMAKLEVGLVVLLGVGGQTHENEHINETIDAIRKMDLDARDIVYFSPFYPLAAAAGHVSLTRDRLRRQYKTFINKLRFAHSSRPIMGIYDIREFLV